MDIRESSDQSDDRKIHPLRRLVVECVQGDQERQCPYLQDDRRKNATVDRFTEESSEEEEEHADNSRRYSQEI